MRLTYNGEKPVLEKHLNQESMITYIGYKLKPKSKWAEDLETSGFKRLSQSFFTKGISRNSDVSKPTIRDHRESGGFLRSYGLISTSSSLFVAASFSKGKNENNNRLAKQPGIILVISNSEKMAIDINGIYKDYEGINDTIWDNEEEFARVKEISGKDILGIYLINDQGIVEKYQKNESSQEEWSDYSLQHVQGVWNQAPIDLTD